MDRVLGEPSGDYGDEEPPYEKELSPGVRARQGLRQAGTYLG
jgi:hypothetical protein